MSSFERLPDHGSRKSFLLDQATLTDGTGLSNAVSRSKGGSHPMTNSLPIPESGFVLTHFLTVADVKRSADFYARILGGEIVLEGEPTMIRIANSWLIVNVGGGPTDDKPDVIL